MTTLSFRSSAFTLSEAAGDIGTVYQKIAVGLPYLGFTDVKNEGNHVFGSNNGYLLDVLYLSNGGQSYWQIIFCSGDVEATNDQLMVEVQTMISGFF